MEGENEKKCLVGGEILRQSDDGIDTVVGYVCDGCRSIFEQAEIDYHLAGEPGDVRSYIAAKLNDAVFVDGTRLKHHRVEVLGLVEGVLGNEHVAYSDAVRLREVLLRGIAVTDYDSQLFENVEGLTLGSALACIDEGKRTFAYIKAIFRYLDKLVGVKDEIEVLDAGCGPVPVFGIMAALKSDKARVVCLEINPVSYEMAKEVVEKLGLEGSVRIVCADAMVYRHNEPVDLLISETMFAGLTNEPMVQILDNLSGQMSDLGRVIPCKVDVHAKLVWPEYNSRDGDEYHGDVEFHQIAALDRVASYVPGKSKLPSIEFVFRLRGGAFLGQCGVMVSSTVDLGEGVVLRDMDSTITRPTRLGKWVVVKEGYKFLKVSYVPGQKKSTAKVEMV